MKEPEPDKDGFVTVGTCRISIRELKELNARWSGEQECYICHYQKEKPTPLSPISFETDAFYRAIKR
jgi:hypothetical protein